IFDIFGGLTKTNHPSTPLYYDEIAQCQIALGNFSAAESSLRNVDRFFRTYNTADREEKALSKFGKEADKIYMGDPYERATNYLLLSLIYISRGDYENALAACKSGILADADSASNQGGSDYTLLQLIEMKLLQVLGKSDGAIQSRNAARASYINTHPSVRELVSDRLSKQELLSMPQQQRDKLKVKETPAELQTQLTEIEEKLATASKEVNSEKDLGVLLSGDYNTLIIVPTGKGPSKGRKGKDGQLIVVETHQNTYERPSVLLDGAVVPVAPVEEVADIDFHAVTRGGRKMDALLQGKAVYRQTTVGAGEFISELGNQMGGMAGLAMVFVGIATQGIGGAMSPEADTRCWQLLPSDFDVYPLNLPPGEHEITVRHRLYFETQSETARKVTIDGHGGMVAVIAPPAPIGWYSDITASGDDMKRGATPVPAGAGKTAVILTPPLGIKKIDRFPSIAEGKKPEAIAADWKKIVRKLEKRLASPSLQLERASHREIVSNYELMEKSIPWAFQTEIEKLDLKMDKEDKVYSLQMRFSLVDTATGKAVSEETITGIFRKSENDKTSSTAAYYKCIDNALEKFLAGKNLPDLMKGNIQSAHL
ncbi:MAG: hypothetical protein M0Z60_03135, partial [Nitrospiraceae bacterium]|nr:hypothetical protein [Nitrospiraceae bacterium]